MSIKAMDRGQCERHGDVLKHYGVCVCCATAKRPNQVHDSQAVLNKLEYDRRRAREVKKRRTALQERAAREARGGMGHPCA